MNVINGCVFLFYDFIIYIVPHETLADNQLLLAHPREERHQGAAVKADPGPHSICLSCIFNMGEHAKC